MTDIAECRRRYAEDVTSAAGITNPRLIQALAQVRREDFLPAGPWWVRDEHDIAGPRRTATDDRCEVYRNYSIAIDVERQLFNGAPGVVAPLIDALALEPGQRVLHIGAGRGYYTSILSHMVGAAGAVIAFEADRELADAARAATRPAGNVDVRTGDASQIDGILDAILVSTGVTHPLPDWIRTLKLDGRMVVPITVTMPAMGPLSKGFTCLLEKASPERLAVRVLGMTMIYAATGLRDASLNERLGQTMLRDRGLPIASVRVDRHEVADTCWAHSPDCCLSTEPAS